MFNIFKWFGYHNDNETNDLMIDQLVNLKLSIKAFAKQHKRNLNEYEKYVKLSKLNVANDRIQFARIFAESAVKAKNDALHSLRMQQRIQIIYSNLYEAQAMNNFSLTLKDIVDEFTNSISTRDVSAISHRMNILEDQCCEMKIINEKPQLNSAEVIQLDTLLSQQLEECTLEMNTRMIEPKSRNAPDTEIESLKQQFNQQYNIVVTDQNNVSKQIDNINENRTYQQNSTKHNSNQDNISNHLQNNNNHLDKNKLRANQYDMSKI